jgi:hypothetical protein
MPELNKLDLADFQTEVFKNFNTLLWMNEVRNKELGERLDLKPEEENSWSSFLSTSFYKTIGYLEKITIEKFFNKRDILEYESKSRALLFNEKIRQILCPHLINIDENLLEEEKVLQAIKILTSELLKQPIKENFDVDKDSHLFAFMTFALFEKGINKYCDA